MCTTLRFWSSCLFWKAFWWPTHTDVSNSSHQLSSYRALRCALTIDSLCFVSADFFQNLLLEYFFVLIVILGFLYMQEALRRREFVKYVCVANAVSCGRSDLYATEPPVLSIWGITLRCQPSHYDIRVNQVHLHVDLQHKTAERGKDRRLGPNQLQSRTEFTAQYISAFYS